MNTTPITFHGVTYTPTNPAHRMHGCTIQRASGPLGIVYLVIRGGELMGTAWDGDGAMAMARPFNPAAS